jgi:hypothetical protein
MSNWQNTNRTEEMRELVWASFLHSALTNENPQCGLCPPGPESSCKYRYKGTGKVYDHPHSLLYVVMEMIKPVFRL